MNDKPIKRSTKHEQKMKWLGKSRAYLEATHPRLWIAIGDEGLAGVGSTVAEAEDAATAKGLTDVLLTGVRSVEYQGVYIVPGFRVVRR